MSWTLAENCKDRYSPLHIHFIPAGLAIESAMKFTKGIVYATLATAVGVSAHEPFEAPNFNLTQALIKNDINISAIPELSAMQKKGGNALGLYPEHGPYVHVLVYMAWNHSSNEAAIMEAAEEYVRTSKNMARNLGVDNDYHYMPYSSGYQPVIAGYGAENMARLDAVSRRYDPSRVFQTLQPGYFKLSGKAPFGVIV